VSKAKRYEGFRSRV